MRQALFTPRGRRELRAAAAWIAADSPAAAENLLEAALAAARLITAKPMLARQQLSLAPARYRFWSLRGYPYILVIDTENDPPAVARFVHAARDLPTVLDEH